MKFTDIIELLRRPVSGGMGAPASVIALNVAVLIAVRLWGVFDSSGALLDALRLVPDWSFIAAHPWTLLTSSFTQVEPVHLAMNMVILWFFARMLGPMRRPVPFVTLYAAGAVAGAVCYTLSGATRPTIGASAAVLAVAMAATVWMPARRVTSGNLFSLRLWWIMAALMLTTDLLSLPAGVEVAHWAHLGGYIAGAVIAGCFRLRVRVAGNASGGAVDDDVRLDRLTAKVRTSGYESLTPDERRALFSLSVTSKPAKK